MYKPLVELEKTGASRTSPPPPSLHVGIIFRVVPSPTSGTCGTPTCPCHGATHPVTAQLFFSLQVNGKTVTESIPNPGCVAQGAEESAE